MPDLRKWLPGYRQYDAIRALRLNYRWAGVWVYLKGRQRSTGKRGWRMVLFHPTEVAQRMHAFADGAFS